MFRLILALLLMGAAPIALIAGRSMRKSDEDGLNIAKAAPALLLVGLAFLGLSCLRSVGAGQVGIPVLFGHVGASLDSGIHLTTPFTSVNEMSIRTETYVMDSHPAEGQVKGDDSVQVLTKDQLTLPADVTILYHVQPERANDLFRQVGDMYEEKIIRTESRTVIRTQAAQFNAVELASTGRTAYAAAIMGGLKDSFAVRGIILESVQIRDVPLPTSVQIAVQNKLNAVQRQEQATTDAATAGIEATGKANAIRIIGDALRSNPLSPCQTIADAYRDGKITTPVFANFCPFAAGAAGAVPLVSIASK